MSLHHHYKRTSIVYFILSGMLFILSLILLLLFFIIDVPPEGNVEFIIWSVYSFVGSIAFLIIAIIKKKRSKTNYKVPILSKDEKDLFKANRLMLVSHVHWLREYDYYALNGKSVARIREDVEGWKKIQTFILHLIGLRAYLKKTLVVENGEKVLFYLEKKRGLHQHYYIYNEENLLISSFKMNVFNPMKQYATIYDHNGNIIGKNDGGFSGIQFKIVNNENVPLIELKYQGVPLEAMELFSGTNGDIVDINREAISDTDLIKYIIAPVIVKLHFR
ncbi:hypothetical protein QA612_19700 [Evansella sp. AB-P1]|uniref:hypothetical protein n=1 Tax=Evansella sp. AB-P1 TaxID=3037653 RepID=UPI00241D69E5|nr:hypothetical protein [Evansella sp. AB-P1]MDG5789685.1 hypothetical protein [Evansella sp. AB-P1]